MNFDHKLTVYCNLRKYEILIITILNKTIAAILLKLYDSLTPLDQFLLKCAAVLGEIVDRKMLEKLMQGSSERDIGICDCIAVYQYNL